MIEANSRISFHPLSLDDMPDMSRWLSDPDVAAWYGEGETSIEHLTAKYSPGIAGEEPTYGFISQVDAVDVGYIQTYPINGYPEYATQLQIEPGAFGIDIFVGEANYRGRGFGTVILKAFTQRIVFAEMGAIVAVIGPEPGNARAIRSYEKAGFAFLKTVYVIDEEDPHDTGEEYLMVKYPD